MYAISKKKNHLLFRSLLDSFRRLYARLRYKSFLLIFLLAGFSKVSRSQTQPSVPKIIPPQPEAAAFVRYGEIPVDYSTGVPKIEIPIYIANSRKLQLPITLSYHASGIKVNDLATPVGLGWVINTGGLIARTVLDVRDEVGVKANFKTTSGFEAARDGLLAQPFSLTALAQLGSKTEQDNSGNLDKQSDRFFYQLPSGKSGAFRYDFLTSQLIKIPYAPIQIKQNKQSQWPYRIEGFVITDDDGTLYNYTVREFFDLPNYERPDSWYLSSIISADKKDTILYSYKNFRNEYSHIVYKETLSWTVAEGTCGAFPENSPYPNPNVTFSLDGVYEPTQGIPLLDKITTLNCIISFNYAGDRQDGPKYRLSDIVILDRATGTQNKKIEFQHSYFGTPSDKNLRLKLHAVVFQPGVDNERYSFRYNPIVLPPYSFRSIPVTHSEDYWGYYNYAGNSQLAMVPYEFLRSNESPLYMGDRHPEQTDHYAKACMLEEITYPTKGKTIFEFERVRAPFVYNYETSETALGGFRVKSITSYVNESDVAFKKTYEYGTPRASSFLLSPEQFKWTSTNIAMKENCVFFSGQGVAGGLRIVTRNSVFSSPIHSFNTVLYDRVTEYNGDGSNNIGKTEYNYITPLLELDDHPIEFEHPMFVHPFSRDRATLVARLSSRIEYKKQGLDYRKVKSQANLYTSFHNESYHTGISVTRKWTYNASVFPPDLYSNCPYETFNDCRNYMNDYHYLKSFQYFDTKAFEEIYLLKQTTTTEYDDAENPSLSKTVTHDYANLNHLFPTSNLTTNSKNETMLTELKYPADFSGAAPYNTMLARNVISPVVEEKRIVNGTLLESVKTNFDFQDVAHDIIAPKTIDVAHASNPAETRIRFTAYDNYGNVTAVSKEHDIKFVYLYDATKSKPIAQVTNAASPDNVAYTSFEDSDEGGWTITMGSKVADITSPTGKKCFQTGSFQKSGLITSEQYILSWWQKQGASVSVSGPVSSDVVSTPGKDGWTLVTRKIINSPTVTISGSGFLDEVRLYPANAQMTTYTYDLLVGITSECDVNNVIRYYEYDAANRLQVIRDNQGNILKSFIYQYKR